MNTLPFQGERMVCVLCQKEQQSDPSHNSQWRCLEIEGTPYYACPDHFPPDTGTSEEFKSAYSEFIRAILKQCARPS